MTLRTHLLNAQKRFSFCVYRKYSDKCVQKELEVPTFCDVYITVPYNLKIKPLNIHKYHNCDKLIIDHNGISNSSLKCSINGNHVTILDNTEDTNIVCNVKIPVKANLYVTSKRDITVGQLDGDKINLKSEEGNITLDTFHGESVKVITKKGDIKFQNVIQASHIEAVVTEYGSISTGRLQGLKLYLKTNKGNMTVNSSYCNKSVFEVLKGNMDLSNLHKTCSILLDEGQLKLNGFDGKLSTVIEKGDGDIYLSRITKDSDIKINEGSLNIKLAELCQEQVKFLINAKEYFGNENLKYVKDSNNYIKINPSVNEETVSINCAQGTVVFECATWEDMIKMKLKK